MLRCVNCSFLWRYPLPRHIRVKEATLVMCNILQSWIFPATLSAEDPICRKCFIILERKSIEYCTGPVPVRDYGYKQVCFVCGVSILRVKTHKVLHNTPEANIVMALIPIQQVHRLERLCMPCWLIVYRNAKKKIQQDQIRQDLLQGNSESIEDEPSIPPSSPLPPSQLHYAPEIAVQENSGSSKPVTLPPPKPKITSRIYKRAASSSRHCIFSECRNKERLMVPSFIKEMLLLEHRLYIPANARICSDHLCNGPWNKLVFNYSDFTGRQMDDMLKIMKRAKRR